MQLGELPLHHLNSCHHKFLWLRISLPSIKYQRQPAHTSTGPHTANPFMQVSMSASLYKHRVANSQPFHVQLSISHQWGAVSQPIQAPSRSNFHTRATGSGSWLISFQVPYKGRQASGSQGQQAVCLFPSVFRCHTRQDRPQGLKCNSKGCGS